MKSNWKVSRNVVGEKSLYQVYRLRNIDAVDHSGNREYDKLFDSEEQAQRRADELNERSEENGTDKRTDD